MPSVCWAASIAIGMTPGGHHRGAWDLMLTPLVWRGQVSPWPAAPRSAVGLVLWGALPEARHRAI
jgi:hypothetical protein